MWLAAWFFLACGGPSTPSPAAPSARSAQPAQTTVAGLAEALKRGAVVIDVRTDQEFRSGHVPGAVHAPLGTPTAEMAERAGLTAGDEVFVICAVGGRSARAAADLTAAGFSAVNVEGGTDAWIAAGKPIHTP